MIDISSILGIYQPYIGFFIFIVSVWLYMFFEHKSILKIKNPDKISKYDIKPEFILSPGHEATDDYSWTKTFLLYVVFIGLFLFLSSTQNFEIFIGGR